MELKPFSLIFLLGAAFSGAIASSVKSTDKLNLEETVLYLKQKLTEMEGKMALLESRETADLIQGVKDELLVAVKDVERKSLERESQLLSKMEELEMESRNNRKDFSAKLQELRQWTTEQRDEVLKRVTEVQMQCEESTMDVAGKLQNTESKFTKIDNQLLVEVLHLKTMSYEAEKKMSSVEQEFTSALERQQLKTNALEAKMSEVASQLQSVDVMRKNISVLAEDLRLQLNKNLTFGFENFHSNLTTKMRVSEKQEEEYANISYVSMLHESLKNVEKGTKDEIRNLENQLTPRIELLEEKSALCNDVLEMKQTVGNHSSQLNRFIQHLLHFHNTCEDEPPSILNGKPLHFDRNPGSIVRYECDQNFVMVGNSTVNCTSGKWAGRPPVCRFFDNTFTLVAYVWRNVTCYSDENSQIMQFSRVHETGRDEKLPTGATTTAREKAAVLDVYGLNFNEKYGLYKCGFEGNGRSAAAVIPFQYQYDTIYFMHSSKVASIGDTIDLEVILTEGRSKVKWKRNGVSVPSWDDMVKVEIPNVQQADAGIYECDHGGKTAIMKLIVRKCEKDLYGEKCDQKCPSCYNGGICHDVLGICVCPPGFRGNNCEVACPQNRFGPDCSHVCLDSDCKYHIFCKSDPYGCSCAPGFTQYTCYRTCEPGWYGADCKQPCHCADGPRACNRYTGACTGGCLPKWTGQSCQIEVDR